MFQTINKRLLKIGFTIFKIIVFITLYIINTRPWTIAMYVWSNKTTRFINYKPRFYYIDNVIDKLVIDWITIAIAANLTASANTLVNKKVNDAILWTITLNLFSSKIDKKTHKYDEGEDVNGINSHEFGRVHAEENGVFWLVPKIVGQANQ